ncbi:hypothetical protein [Streptomyces sp. NPDC005865]|uniref:hypothetical protein n=1 Tax=Streptomyces sp. NPDC005865 TaxID=3155453 RepID=UPI0033F72657
MARLVRCGPEGDTPAGLSAADLVGSWRGAPLGTLRLAADGTFTAEDWPVLEDFEKISKTTKGIPGKGTWTVERGMGDDKDDRDLDLDPAIRLHGRASRRPAQRVRHRGREGLLAGLHLLRRPRPLRVPHPDARLNRRLNRLPCHRLPAPTPVHRG